MTGILGGLIGSLAGLAKPSTVESLVIAGGCAGGSGTYNG